MFLRIDQELFIGEAAATGGWAAVSVLENKPFEKITGASDADKELKTQRIRKAIETARKEESLYKKYERKPMKRPGQHKKFGEKYHAYGEQDESGSVGFGGFGGGGRFYGAYGRQEGGSGAEPAGNYQAAHNRRGYGGYGATVATEAMRARGREARREAGPGLTEPATGARARATLWLPARCPRLRKNSEARPRYKSTLVMLLKPWSR